MNHRSRPTASSGPDLVTHEGPLWFRTRKGVTGAELVDQLRRDQPMAHASLKDLRNYLAPYPEAAMPIPAATIDATGLTMVRLTDPSEAAALGTLAYWRARGVEVHGAVLPRSSAGRTRFVLSPGPAFTFLVTEARLFTLRENQPLHEIPFTRSLLVEDLGNEPTAARARAADAIRAVLSSRLPTAGEIDALTRDYGRRVLVEGLTLEVERSLRVALTNARRTGSYTPPGARPRDGYSDDRLIGEPFDPRGGAYGALWRAASGFG